MSNPGPQGWHPQNWHRHRPHGIACPTSRPPHPTQGALSKEGNACGVLMGPHPSPGPWGTLGFRYFRHMSNASDDALAGWRGADSGPPGVTALICSPETHSHCERLKVRSSGCPRAPPTLERVLGWGAGEKVQARGGMAWSFLGDFHVGTQPLTQAPPKPLPSLQLWGAGGNWFFSKGSWKKNPSAQVSVSPCPSGRSH